MRSNNSKSRLDEGIGGFVGLSPINSMPSHSNRDNFSFNGVSSIGAQQKAAEESNMELTEQALSGSKVASAYCNDDQTSFTLEIEDGPLIEIQSAGDRLKIIKID